MPKIGTDFTIGGDFVKSASEPVTLPPADSNLNQILSELENIYKFKDLLLMP